LTGFNTFDHLVVVYFLGHPEYTVGVLYISYSVEDAQRHKQELLPLAPAPNPQ